MASSKKSLWPIFFSIVIVVIGLSLSALFGTLSLSVIIMTTILVFFAALAGGAVTLLTAKQRINNAEDSIEDKIRHLSNEIGGFQGEVAKIVEQSQRCVDCANLLNLTGSTLNQIIRGQFGESLITYEKLKQIERNVNNDQEIWVLTSALHLEADELDEIIIDNFKKGIKYKYLIPKEDIFLQEKMASLARKWQKDSGMSNEDAEKQIQCFLVPKHFAYMTVIIYEPYNGQTPKVLVKFPTSEFYEKEKYPLIYQVGSKPKQAWQEFVQSLQEMIHHQRNCKLTEPLKFDFSIKI